MRLIYLKPQLKDLTQASRIACARQTRYEKGERSPKEDRIIEIANILKVNPKSIGKYDGSNPLDIVYTFMWEEELYPKMKVDLGLSE